MIFSLNSVHWCLSESCDMIRPVPSQLTRIRSRAGASQLLVEVGPVFTSSKTSPGTANMFINRAASDIVAGLGRAGGSEIEGGCSMRVLNFDDGPIGHAC